MKFTRSQLHERITDLSGQLRAAEENKRLTSAKRAEEERLADQARQADEKADEHLARVRSELRDAARDYGVAVEEMMGVCEEEAAGPGLADPRPAGQIESYYAGVDSLPNFNSYYTEAPNDRGVNEAFEQATNPQ